MVLPLALRLLQALKQVLAVLMIRRTRDEVAAEHYTIPPQRHSVVEVAQRHCDAFMTRQLQKTARQVGDFPHCKGSCTRCTDMR